MLSSRRGKVLIFSLLNPVSSTHMMQLYHTLLFA